MPDKPITIKFFSEYNFLTGCYLEKRINYLPEIPIHMIILSEIKKKNICKRIEKHAYELIKERCPEITDPESSTIDHKNDKVLIKFHSNKTLLLDDKSTTIHEFSPIKEKKYCVKLKADRCYYHKSCNRWGVIFEIEQIFTDSKYLPKPNVKTPELSFKQILEMCDQPLRVEDFNDEVRLYCNNCSHFIGKCSVEYCIAKNTCDKCNTEGKLGRFFL